MGIKPNASEGEYACGKGTVYVFRKDPKQYVMKEDGDRIYVEIVKRMYEDKAKGGKLEFKNNFYLKRGMYELVSVMDESVSDKPYQLKGRFIDLFDPQLPVLAQKTVNPGEQAFLINLDQVKNPDQPQVLCGAARVYDEKVKKASYSFVAKSPAETTNVMRVLLPAAPKKVKIQDAEGEDIKEATSEWDEASRTLLLTFENSPEGVQVKCKW